MKCMTARFGLLFLTIFLICSCKPKKIETIHAKEGQNTAIISSNEKYVLAQWSFNKKMFAGEMNTKDYIRKAKSLGFMGVELVNQFFLEEVENKAFFSGLLDVANESDMKITLLMIDRAGELGSKNPDERKEAVAQHKKWMIASSWLNCPTIRVNAHGSGTAEEMKASCFESIKELANFGKTIGVNVIVENHGQYSSDGKWLSSLVGELYPYGVGSLADFDNWCIEREGGKLWGAPCINKYDRYQGMKELLPTAKSISLKAFEFDHNGEAIKTDFKKMFELIKEAQYDEYLAVEFEGHDMDAEEGVKKTFELAKRYNKK